MNVNQLKENLLSVILDVPEIKDTLEVLYSYELPNHYLAGGVITQCLWNHLLGNEPLRAVKDFDVVYFSNEPRSAEVSHEKLINQNVSHRFPIDIKNQANLHEWYGTKFGNEIEPLNEVEDGIRMWLSAFAVGIRKTESGYEVFSPYGLEDQHKMIVRPNKLAMSQQNYEKMTASFQRRWSEITVLEWD